MSPFQGLTGDCKALTTEDTIWSFCPSLAASIVLLVIFLIVTVAHIGQAIYHRKTYSIVIVASCLAQALTYIFRTLSIQSPASFPYYAAWFILILISPLLTNAFVYMVFGRMVWNFSSRQKIWKIKPWNLTTLFVFLDLLALLIQIYGAVRATNQDISTDEVLQGLHVYMGGVGVQQCFILVFCGLAFSLFRTIRREQSPGPVRSRALLLLSALFVALALITVR